MNEFKHLIFLLLLVLLFVGCSRVRTTKSQQDVPRPETEPSQVGELSEPEQSQQPAAAVRDFFEGIVDGNVEQAKSALVLSDRVEEYLMANIEVVRAMDEFAELDNEKFGPGGMPIGLMRRSMLGGLDNMTTKMLGEDRAECMVAPPNPMMLFKTESGWKIDFTGKASETLLELAPKAHRDTVKMLDSIRDNILEGRITSRAESQKEMKRLKAEYGL